MPAPSDSRVETALVEPAPQPPRPPRPDDARPPAGPHGEPAGYPRSGSPRREPFLTALLRAFAVWPT